MKSFAILTDVTAERTAVASGRGNDDVIRSAQFDTAQRGGRHHAQPLFHPERVSVACRAGCAQLPDRQPGAHLIGALAGLSMEDADLVMPTDGRGRDHPLVACWGRSMRRLVDDAGAWAVVSADKPVDGDLYEVAGGKVNLKEGAGFGAGDKEIRPGKLHGLGVSPEPDLGTIVRLQRRENPFALI